MMRYGGSRKAVDLDSSQACTRSKRGASLVVQVRQGTIDDRVREQVGLGGVVRSVQCLGDFSRVRPMGNLGRRGEGDRCRGVCRRRRVSVL